MQSRESLGFELILALADCFGFWTPGSGPHREGLPSHHKRSDSVYPATDLVFSDFRLLARREVHLSAPSVSKLRKGILFLRRFAWPLESTVKVY